MKFWEHYRRNLAGSDVTLTDRKPATGFDRRTAQSGDTAGMFLASSLVAIHT